MTNTPRVLVVDGLAETEAVLKAVFEPQGTRIERRRSMDARGQCAAPEVLVVDLDDQTAQALDRSIWPDVPRVVLSSVPSGSTGGQDRFLEKPFQYPELVRLVTSLLAAPTESRRVA